MLADLDSSCLGGLSEGEGSAVECSLTEHGLPPCNWLHYSCCYKLAMQSHTESDGVEMQCLLHCLQYIWLLKMRCICLQSNQCWNQYMKRTIWYLFIHTHRYCRSTLFSLFSTNLCSHACIMAFVLPPPTQYPAQETKHCYQVNIFSHHNTRKEMSKGVVHLAN